MKRVHMVDQHHGDWDIPLTRGERVVVWGLGVVCVAWVGFLAWTFLRLVWWAVTGEQLE